MRALIAPSRVSLMVVLVLVGVLLVGCAAPAATPAPPAPTNVVPPPATPTAAPSPASANIHSAWQLATPVPTSPAAGPLAPTPTSESSAAIELLRQARDQQAEPPTSGRGTMDMSIEVKEAEIPFAMAFTMDMEFIGTDSHMTMSTKGDSSPISFDMESVVKGDTVYTRMGKQWSATPNTGEMNPAGSFGFGDLGDMEEFLDFAQDVQLVGRRDVKGVECDVVSFVLPADLMKELMAMGASAARGGDKALDELEIGVFDGEFAIGVDDKQLHQMVIKMSMGAKREPAVKMIMTITITMWDLNSPDIVITAPEGVDPATSDAPTT